MTNLLIQKLQRYCHNWAQYSKASDHNIELKNPP